MTAIPARVRPAECPKCGARASAAENERGETIKISCTKGCRLPQRSAERHSEAVRSGLIVTTLSEVQPEAVAWLWRDRIPLGKLTLLIGDPAGGKSYTSLAITSALTNGVSLPGGDKPDGPVDVLLAAYEDGLADTVRPRADLLAVDVSRFHAIEGAVGEDGKRRPFHTSDLAELEWTLDAMPAARLLIVDPVVSLIGGRVDAYRDNEVRDALYPLVNLAARRNIAVLGVMHLRKGAADRAIYRIGGSGGFGALARSVLLVAQDQESGRRALAHVKSNLGPLKEPLEFCLTSRGLVWVGVAPDLSVDRLLAPAPTDTQSERDEATAFLIESLASGSRLASEMYSEGEALGIAKRTLERARARLGVVVRKRHQSGSGRGAGSWEWALPNPDGGDVETPDPDAGSLDPRAKT